MKKIKIIFVYFLDIESKGVWFFLPIGSLLVINAILFILTIKEVFLLDWEAKRLNYIQGNRDYREHLGSKYA